MLNRFAKPELEVIRFENNIIAASGLFGFWAENFTENEEEIQAGETVKVGGDAGTGTG